MAEEALVVFVDVVVDERVLSHGVLEDGVAETLEHLFEDWLVEDHALAVEDALHVATGEEFAALEYDAVSSCIKGIDP